MWKVIHKNIHNSLLILYYFRSENGYHSIRRGNSTKEAARSLSLSTHWAGRSRNAKDAIMDDCEQFDQEISLFWEKYVQPCAQSSSKRSKSHLSLCSKYDSGQFSFESESPNVSLISTSSWLESSSKILPMMQKSGHDNSEICDNLAIEADKTVKLLSDNTKHKSDKSKANPISRSHTLSLLPYYSCKTTVTVNGQSFYERCWYTGWIQIKWVSVNLC